MKHYCKLEDGTEIIQLGLSELLIQLERDCGDPICGCTRNVPINFCPVCGYHYQPERSKREDKVEKLPCILCLGDTESPKCKFTCNK